jgi:folate-dependent phosphoribosylglycinamide formyltransferase PurN
MRITVFTSNQPRHLALVSGLAKIAAEVFVVQECNTVFPGVVTDFFRSSEVMYRYFLRVIAAEEAVFGGVRFSPPNVRTLAVKSGDISRLGISLLDDALKSDLYVVFGASYIKGALLEFLVAKRAVNIHMGVSPYYRGSSCNFWALYDRNPDLVGATIHHLSAGLDSGDMLFHALPKPGALDPFLLGMLAVRAAHGSLIESIESRTVFDLKPVRQEKGRQIRYTQNADFTDEVAADYLSRLPSPEEVESALQSAPGRPLLRTSYF